VLSLVSAKSSTTAFSVNGQALFQSSAAAHKKTQIAIAATTQALRRNAEERCLLGFGDGSAARVRVADDMNLDSKMPVNGRKLRDKFQMHRPAAVHRLLLDSPVGPCCVLKMQDTPR